MPPLAPRALGQRRQVRDRLAGREPAGGIEVEPLDQARRARPQLRRQRRHDLELGGGDHGPEPELRGRTRQARQEERLRLVRGHPGEARPVSVDEADPAMRPPIGVDRDARGAQGVDVAMDASDADFELARELGRRHAAARLEEQQQRDETGGAHGGQHTRRYMPEAVMERRDGWRDLECPRGPARRGEPARGGEVGARRVRGARDDGDRDGRPPPAGRLSADRLEPDARTGRGSRRRGCP